MDYVLPLCKDCRENVDPCCTSRISQTMLRWPIRYDAINFGEQCFMTNPWLSVDPFTRMDACREATPRKDTTIKIRLSSLDHPQRNTRQYRRQPEILQQAICWNITTSHMLESSNTSELRSPRNYHSNTASALTARHQVPRTAIV